MAVSEPSIGRPHNLLQLQEFRKKAGELVVDLGSAVGHYIDSVSDDNETNIKAYIWDGSSFQCTKVNWLRQLACCMSPPAVRNPTPGA